MKRKKKEKMKLIQMGFYNNEKKKGTKRGHDLFQI